MRKTLLLLVVVGCGYRERSEIVHANEIGSARARITNYLSAPVRGGSPTENTPAGISREAIVDEARLDILTPGQTCISFVLRTHVDLDMPLTDWNFKLAEKRVDPVNELVTVRDHSFRGERDVVVADAVTATSFASLRVTEPTTEVFRVFERAGHTCGPTAGGKIVFEVERPMDDHRGSWGESFVWNIQ